MKDAEFPITGRNEVKSGKGERYDSDKIVRKEEIRKQRLSS